jgi:ornithine cyclodeaminase/alanine dehydrogenase-like protein (mu-crystallin family)
MNTVFPPATGSPITGEASLALVRAVAEEMRAGLRSGAVRRMLVPPRETVTDAMDAKFISMPAVSPDYDLFVNKTATIVEPRSDLRASAQLAPLLGSARDASSLAGLPGSAATVASVVPMFSVSTGRFLGVLDGNLVTNLKCAAVTALVTDRCAAPDAPVLGIIGSGVQARQQFLGVSAVRTVTEVRIHSRNADRAASFAREVEALAARDSRPVHVVVCDTAEQASRGVDILGTATTSSDPLPLSAELPEHVHINCMGAHTVTSRELAADLLRHSLLIVEDLATAVAEAGPLHRAAVELDLLLTPAADGYAARRTIFSSTGCAYLDLITCAYLRMREDGRDGTAHDSEVASHG